MRRTAVLLLIVLASLALAVGRPTLKAVGKGGTVLFLSNGKAYEVKVEDRARAANWPKGVAVATYTIEDRNFPYRIVLHPGQDDAEAVSANRLLPADRAPRQRAAFSITRG